jgi:DeoR family transcriptional regulator, suf operon transcriptional repressor
MANPVGDLVLEGVVPGHKGPRGLIILALKRSGSLTARDLGQHLGLSANAIRHHLKELEAEGVIGYRREQRGLGAPTFAWHLSPSGEALFPQRNQELLTDILDRVAERSGREAVVSAVETRFADLADKLRGDLTNASPEQRLEVVMRTLVEGGYMAEWNGGAGEFRLTEHNCAVRTLAARFPEICAAEERFLEDVLAAVVQRESHMLDGCSACEYRVQFPGSGDPPPTTLQGLPAGEERA